jgi:hypothetical protein
LVLEFNKDAFEKWLNRRLEELVLKIKEGFFRIFGPIKQWDAILG